jgi:hypothetical protein
VELAGHAAVGHLRLGGIIQGEEIVLEGVESGEASNIAGAVERGVDAANHDCADGKDIDQSEYARHTEVSSIADEVRASQRRPEPETPV